MGYGENIAQNINKTHKAIVAEFNAAVKASLQDSDEFGAAIAGQLYTERIAKDNLTLPQPTDVNGLATLWKTLYNTSSGKGSVSEFVDKWNAVYKGEK